MRSDLAALLRLQADLASTARDQSKIAARMLEEFADLDDGVHETGKASEIIKLFRGSEQQLCRAGELLHIVARQLERLVKDDHAVEHWQGQIRDAFRELAEEQAGSAVSTGSRERRDE